MGVMKFTGNLLWGATKLTGKALAVTARAAYDHREAIGNAAAETAKFTGKTTWSAAKLTGKGLAVVATTTYDHRDAIAGTVAGAAKGSVGVVAEAYAHIGHAEAVRKQAEVIELQAKVYEGLGRDLQRKLGPRPSKAVLLDSTVVAGQTLADYIDLGKVPPEIQKAYELAYPELAADHSFVEEHRRLDSEQMLGFASGVKGKLFELEYLDYLNDGHLPDGYQAHLATSATQPGWDIAITGPDGDFAEAIQLKATDSVSYVQNALDRYPNIDVVTTSEVHAHLVMMGAVDGVADSHIANHALDAAIGSGMDQAIGAMHWTPSVVSLALIAFSAYTREDLSLYQKSRVAGERSVKSYVAYLAGGTAALATGVWWIGMLGGIGTRMFLASGRKKRDELLGMCELRESNKIVLNRLSMQLAKPSCDT